MRVWDWDWGVGGRGGGDLVSWKGLGQNIKLLICSSGLHRFTGFESMMWTDIFPLIHVSKTMDESNSPLQQ